MSPVAKVVAYILLVLLVALRDLPDLLGGHHVLQGCCGGQPGALLHSLRGFPAEPRCLARPIHQRSQLRSLCHRSCGSSCCCVYNSFAFVVSPVVTLQPMEPQICKVYLAFTNSLVIEHRLNRALRGDRQHGGLCAGPHPVQAEVRQHRDVRAADAAGDPRHQLCRHSLVAVTLPWRSALFFLLVARLRQAFQAHARQWRHPVLDHLPAHPAADRGDHSDLHDVPGRGPARHPSGADHRLCGGQPAHRRLADA